MTSKEIHEIIIKKLASTPGMPITCLRSFGDTDVSSCRLGLTGMWLGASDEKKQGNYLKRTNLTL